MKTLGLFLASVLLCSKAHGFFGYQISQGPNDTAFKDNAQILLNQAQQLLPNSVKSAIGNPLEVRFASLSGKDGALGVYSQGRLTLDLKTIPEIRKGEKNATPTNRSHKTFYREILATVLHETIHAYDGLNLHSPIERKLIEACRDERRNRKDNQESPECSFYKNINKTFSQNPYFTLAAGFVYDDVSWFKHRSPDIYELTSLSEALAVNMEYFLLDPDYACRRPTLYKLLQNQFQHTPYQVSCKASLSYVVSDFISKADPIKNIDPSRVYQIHYLMATSGDDASSGFGHAMYRIVMCSPQRKTVGPECLNDLEDHLVLSYRAFVDTPQINNFKGMNGDYPSRLFIIPFNQVLEEYNRTELRDLKSFPLNLSHAEMERFVVRSVETHWSYDGQYYFASNNCAVESLNLLRSSLLRPELLTIGTVTPNGLKMALSQRDLLQEPDFNNRTDAINKGFLFESYKDRYELSYQILRGYLNTPQKDFSEFLALPASSRRAFYNKISSLPSSFQVKTAAAIMILEKASQRMEVQKMKEELAEKMLKKNSLSNSKAEQLARLDGLFSSPSYFLANAKGYGLPFPEDMVSVKSRSTSLQKQGGAIYDELTQQARGLLSPQHQRDLQTSRDSIAFAQGYLHSVL